MKNEYRSLTEEERNGKFHFTQSELKGKTIIHAVSERCLKGIFADLEKAGIVVKEWEVIAWANADFVKR